MFGIGLPEMIVILVVALIVVGPEKLPDLARSVAKWAFDLKRTVNQVKDSLADEEDLFDSVQSDLRKTRDELKGNLLDSEHFTWHNPPEEQAKVDKGDLKEIIDVYDQQSEEAAGEEMAAGEADQPGDEANRAEGISREDHLPDKS